MQFRPIVVDVAGCNGQWLFQSSSTECEDNQDTSDYKCRVWYHRQNSVHAGRKFLLQVAPRVVPVCPCVWWQAVWDPRFIVELDRGCAISAWLFLDTIAQVCRSDVVASDVYVFLYYFEFLSCIIYLIVPDY